MPYLARTVSAPVDGSTSNFAFDWSYLNQAHVQVRVLPPSASELPAALTLGTDYSFTSTSIVHLTTPPAAGSVVDIRRSTPAPSPLPSPSTIVAADLNTISTTLLYIAQEVNDLAADASADAVKVPTAEVGPTVPSVAARRNKYFYWGSSGEAMAVAGTGAVGDAQLVLLEDGTTVEDAVERLTMGAIPQTQRFMAALERNSADVHMLVMADSTADDTTEWPALLHLGGRVLSRYPEFTVKRRPWDYTATNTYAPASEVTLQVGTGAHTVYIWTGAVPGSAANYFAGPLFAEAAKGVTMDVGFLGYDLNGADVSRQYSWMTALLHRFARELPQLPLVLIGENPSLSGGADDGTMLPKILAGQRLAAEFGAGFIDLYTRFYTQGVPLATLIPDGTHPGTAQAKAIAADAVSDACTYSPRGTRGPLPAPHRFQLFSAGSLDTDLDGWAAFGTATKAFSTTLADYLSGGVALHVTSTGGSAGIQKLIVPSTSIKALQGKTICVTPWLLVDPTSPTASGRIQVYDGVDTTDTGQYPARGLYGPAPIVHKVNGSATGITVTIFASESGGGAGGFWFDRWTAGEGYTAPDILPLPPAAVPEQDFIGGKAGALCRVFNSAGDSEWGFAFLSANSGTARDAISQYVAASGPSGFAIKPRGKTYPRAGLLSNSLQLGTGDNPPSCTFIANGEGECEYIGSFIYPSTDGTVVFGLPNLQWKSAYIKDGIYINGHLKLQHQTPVTATAAATDAATTQTLANDIRALLIAEGLWL